MSPADTDPVREIAEFLRPHVASVVKRINVDEFTTVELIQVMQLDEPSRMAYEEALRRWSERDETLSKMVVHGQAIPLALRQTSLVEWAGYAHGESDPYAVPAWWRKTGADVDG
jgi:hypothetical protein